MESHGECNFLVALDCILHGMAISCFAMPGLLRCWKERLQGLEGLWFANMHGFPIESEFEACQAYKPKQIEVNS